MENSLLMTLTALLLLGVREGQGQGQGQGLADQNITSNSTTPSTSQCPNVTTPTATQTPCPEPIQTITPFRLKFIWNEASPCEGQLYVDSHEHGGPKDLCYKSHTPDSLLTEVCKDRRCERFKRIKKTSIEADGLMLTDNMTLINTQCRGLQIMCEGDTLGTELAAYKAVTGILISLILGVILVRFSRPTYKAIRKRFSQKRESRWVGPTQSVCYNRGQEPPNKNTEKRLSYPGLERLTVNQSREPSSNRNSDYDSYN